MTTFNLFQGNLFDQEVVFEYTGFDFTDSVITAQLRTSVDSESVVHQFSITPDFTTVGEATFRLQIPKAESENLEIRTYYGDIRIERASPAYGPYTVSSFQIKVTKPATRE